MQLVITAIEQLEEYTDEYPSLERNFDVKVEFTPYIHIILSTENSQRFCVRKSDVLALAAIIKSQEN